MAKKTPKKRANSKSQKKKKASNQNLGLKIFAMIFILAMVIGFVYPLIIKTPNSIQTEGFPQSTSTSSSTPIPPEFKKEGELNFIKHESGDSLKIDVEIAQTEEETSQGLMFRTELGSRQGMLFIFDKPDMRSFWMKNTYIPLDIMFVDSSLQIITVHANTQPFSKESVNSSGRAQYVVEVEGGFCARNGIEEGDRISFKTLKKR